jgi:hypothetical protein
MSKFKQQPNTTHAPAPKEPEKAPVPTETPEPATMTDSVTDWLADHWMGLLLLAALVCVIVIFGGDFTR